MARKTRSYTKRNPEYWASRKVPAQTQIQAATLQHTDLPVAFVDERQVSASCGAGRGTSYVNNGAPILTNDMYPNIAAGVMPFSAAGGYYTMAVPINLATLAYFNIALVRNTINLLQDFSISPLRLTTKNKTVEAFFTRWFESVNLSDFMAQWFLEYYRSGNVFIYKFNGKIADDKFAKMKTAFAGATSQEIPIRYIILDPKQVYLQVGPNYKGAYSRMLSTFELERLRNPQTPEDKQVLRDFPPEIQKQIKSTGSQPWVYAPLDTSRLYYCFYRKQDYEPLAVPMIWPLIRRLEYKLMLETADMSLVQTMEQVFMLVTAGCAPDRDKGNLGTNPKQLENLQRVFQNQTIGRVLVGDYTTEAKFITPDLKGLLGHEKYSQVDKDIREGLGYMFFGEDKFATAAIKAKLFVQGLEEGRRVFLDNFLRPEIKKICEALGFKNVPKVEFEKIDVSDQSAIQRIYMSMAQFGLLTPEQLYEALSTGLLPRKDESVPDQEAYKTARDKGLYEPLAPSKDDGSMGRPAGSKTKMPNKKVGTRAFDISRTVDNVKAATQIQEDFEKAYRKHYKLKSLSEVQKTFVSQAAKAVFINEPRDKWNEAIASYITDPKNIDPKVNFELAQIASEHDTDAWTAAALYHSQTERVE